jgi:DmsE family decaheme c-type cytochrome
LLGAGWSGSPLGSAVCTPRFRTTVESLPAPGTHPEGNSKDFTMLKFLFGKTFALTLLLAGFADWGFARTPRSPQEPAAPSQKNEFVSSVTCSSCHEDLFRKFSRNPHQILETSEKRGWKDQSCESCHGPGQAHVDAGDGSKVFAYPRVSAKEASKNCLTCHARTETHAGRPTSLHAKNQLTCTDCHSVHQPKEPRYLLAEKSDQLCISCHKETQAAFAKPFRHRLQEGAIRCVDCHAPHGGLNPRQMQTARGNEAACARCHSDKRGPFAFEHAAMRLEGCMSCHEPHGSVNPKMLVRTQQHLLCLECHSTAPGILASQPPAFHDLRSARFLNCTTCHLKVHGSNVNRFLLR